MAILRAEPGDDFQEVAKLEFFGYLGCCKVTLINGHEHELNPPPIWVNNTQFFPRPLVDLKRNLIIINPSQPIPQR